jgi:hypothetical protein
MAITLLTDHVWQTLGAPSPNRSTLDFLRKVLSNWVEEFAADAFAGAGAAGLKVHGASIKSLLLFCIRSLRLQCEAKSHRSTTHPFLNRRA